MVLGDISGQKIDPILLEGFGKAKVDELQGMVAVVLVNLGFEGALAANN